MKHIANLVLVAVLFSVLPAWAADEVTRPIEFPVQGEANFSDDFSDPRSGGRSHAGIDILAKKMTPVVAAMDGEVAWLTETEQSYGWMLVLRDFDGWTYHYIHINNDTPGTDDGMGGREHAFAPGIEQGASVKKGQLVAWVGDSGNAENISSHLHFEIHNPDDVPINPYQSLIQASRPGFYKPAEETAASPTINDDKHLSIDPGQQVFCVSGSLIRSVSSSTVYYCGANGKRYVFPNPRVYQSWYKDFTGVKTISDTEMAAVTLGGNVTYRPGVKLVKIQSDPKVYAVGRGGMLRWVVSPEVAAKLYGASWAKNVDDVDVTFWLNYKVGDPITVAP